MEIKSVKKQALHNPTKWTRKGGSLVKVKIEPEQQAGYGEESEANVTASGSTKGLINVQIKEEQTEFELHEPSEDGGSNHHTEVPLNDSDAIISKSEQDQVYISPGAVKDEKSSDTESESHEMEVKRETDLCIKDESGTELEDSAQDIDAWMRAEDNGVSSAQFFPCPECTVSFTKWSGLERHMKWNHQREYHALLKRHFSNSKSYLSPSLSCPHCSLTFHTSRQLTIHTHQAHPSAPPRRRHPCPTCARSFQYLGNLERHCKRWHKMAVTCTKGHLSCADCGKSFKTTWGQGQHRCDEPNDTKPGDGPVCLDTGVPCSECGKILHGAQSLAVHMHTHTGEKPYVCKDCGKSFSDGSSLRKHMLIHSGVKSHKCQVCAKTFARTGHLRSHMTTHSGEKAHSCPECGKRFGLKTSLTSHLRTHTGEQPFHCTICGKDFSRSNNLKLHLKLHRNQKDHHCSECGLKAVNAASLKDHMRTHTGERPYHCTVCGKQFIRSEHLKNHQRTHTGEKPYKCTECDKSFVQSGDLVRHKRIHAGVKPFECPDCHRRFTASGDLVKHSRSHTDLRPYTCQECGKGFRLSGHLKSHMATHTGEKPYSCPCCHRRFARSHHLACHLTRCT